MSSVVDTNLHHVFLPNGTKILTDENGGITWVDQIIQDVGPEKAEDYVLVVVKRDDARLYNGGSKRLVFRNKQNSIITAIPILSPDDPYTLDNGATARRYGLNPEASYLLRVTFFVSRMMRLFTRGNYDYTPQLNASVEEV